MNKEKDLIYIEDIVDSIEKIKKYIHDMSLEDFKKNDLVQDAVLRNLEIIGEASNNLAEEIKRKHKEVPWKRMIGLRNIISHKYFGIDLEIIWKIITVNLPGTKGLVNSILKNHL